MQDSRLLQDKTACIISCFDYYVERTKFVEEYLCNKGFNVVHLTARFNHYKKEFNDMYRKNQVLIETCKYMHNVSISRILSHYQFSKHVYNYLSEHKPDFIWCVVPPNFLVKRLHQYKKYNCNVKLVFDIFDLWPESLMSGFKSKFPFVKLWKDLRDKYLSTADFIFSESHYFANELSCANNIHTLYICKEKYSCDKENIDKKLLLLQNEINFCYLGNINYLIDIDKICNIIKKIVLKTKKKINVHIIGGGEKKDLFINQLLMTNANIKYYGIVYDENMKHNIYDKCHFGINIMKNDVKVALTMKSLNYFEAGLPLISNIKSDTYNLIKKYGIGFNIKDNDDVVNDVIGIDRDAYKQLALNVMKVYDMFFSKKAFEHLLNNYKIC